MAYPTRSPVPSHKNVRGRFGGFLLFPDLARSKSSKRNGKLSKENPANWPGEQIVPIAKAQNFRNLSLVSVNSSLAFWTKNEFRPTSTPVPMPAASIWTASFDYSAKLHERLIPLAQVTL